MATTMHVEVVSAERHVLSADAVELYARSVEGEIGILPGHQPALIELDIAPVRVKLEDGTWETIAVHHGLLYVGRDGLIVLADVAEPASSIDAARAETALRELEGRQAAGDDPVLRASIQRARTRLTVADG
ncbi:ATP synthase F1 subunit epsilon [Egicoccus halophilus]|uniref:ATP synthase epsilon chain n=1 Tax=Egicoccus halophilus TaxID=1670830 RepID=A0A8J3A8D1_9ACTN|nr:ATP synthase F1 subunit epsilon [Egicoccus halophilus]GGI04045.1 ATP synthase epsilon chain [Egicoccus halophilus]